MKLFVELEPDLRRQLRPKSSRRKSFKWLKKLRNKAIRNQLKINLDYGKEIIKRVRDWEY